MLSHKKLYPFQSLTSNSMHPFVQMQTGFSVNFILHSSFSLYHGLLSASCDSFSLPVLFQGFFPLSDCRKFFLLEKRPKVRIFLRFGGDSPKTHIFPFTEDFQSSLPTTRKWPDETVTAWYVQPSQLEQDICSWVAVPGVIPAGAWYQGACTGFASLKHCILPIKYWDKTDVTDIYW